MLISLQKKKKSPKHTFLVEDSKSLFKRKGGAILIASDVLSGVFAKQK